MNFFTRKPRARTSPHRDIACISVETMSPHCECARDWMHERRIEVLGRVYVSARAHGDACSVWVWDDLRDALRVRESVRQ